MRNEHTDYGLVKEIETMGRRALPLQMDVSKMSEIHVAIEQIKKFYGRKALKPVLPGCLKNIRLRTL